jgi:hypothetical protein
MHSGIRSQLLDLEQGETIDDGAQNLLGDTRVEALVFGEIGYPGEHDVFPGAIDDRHAVSSLVTNHALDESRPFGQEGHKPAVDCVDPPAYRM